MILALLHSLGDNLHFIGVVVLVAVTLLAFWLGLAGGGPRKRIQDRAQAARRRLAPALPRASAVMRLKREADRSRLDRLVSRIVPKPEHWRRRLELSGTNISLGTIGAVAFGLLVVFGLGLSFMGMNPLIAWPVGLAVGVLVPRFFVERLIRRRTNGFTKLLPDAIGLMVRGIRSGLPVSETILTASREIGDPLGEELRRVADQLMLGQPLEDVMWAMASRIEMPEFTFMAITFSIQRETGGNLAETLDNLDTLLRRRRQMHLKVRAYSAEARASAMIIGSLPFIMLALLSFVNWDYISTLYFTSTGHILLAAAFGSVALGLITLAKMARFEI